ncbi:hypothetical protein TRIUR3_22420 [Triticum urartu]|uniref:Uncharacterized protein n=1 Tax=Triticum urartu TaxID=4572 RepID=M7ZTX1_TRIUA|nr:hypothetical protein TRIUR3_22420 [Triticum urartu]
MDALVPYVQRELQLVSVCALLIACKYDEIWAPEGWQFFPWVWVPVGTLPENNGNGQDLKRFSTHGEQILRMEKAILNMLEWNLTVPTPYVFLVRFAKAASS